MKVLVTTITTEGPTTVETAMFDCIDLIDAVLIDCCNAITREELLLPNEQALPGQEIDIHITDECIVWVDGNFNTTTTYTKVGESKPGTYVTPAEDYVLVKARPVAKPTLTLV